MPTRPQAEEEANMTSIMSNNGEDAPEVREEPSTLGADDAREASSAKVVATDIVMDISSSMENGRESDLSVKVDTSSRKRPRISISTDSAKQSTTSKNNDGVNENDHDEDMSGLTQEPMKGGNDNHAGASTEPATNKQTEPLHYLSVTLDYEPMDDGTAGRRSQILTVTYNGGGAGGGGANGKIPPNSSTVVGTISGRARIDILPPLSDREETKKNSSTASAAKSLRQPALSLDVFGYRMPQPCNDDGKELSDPEIDNSVIINRSDWMNSLPISVVVDDSHRAEAGVATPATMFRVRIESLSNETTDEQSLFVNGGDTDGVGGGASGECSYYSAYPEESYQLNLLSPTSLYPGNYTAVGSGVCTVLRPWKDALDQITDTNIGDWAKSEIHPLGDGNNITPSMDCNKNAQQPEQAIAMPTLETNNSKILICGAKGVGKSTLLRYATNRILSAPASCDTGTSGSNNGSSSLQQYPRVAILDLDCGQPELSPPGMLALTVISRPLLSDPPVHMICGGSCDHHGTRRKEDGAVKDAVSNDESEGRGGGDSMQHEAACFFGDITSKADPDTYIQMARQIMRRYYELLELEKQQYGNNGSLPLLVNTDGWVKGLGYEILSAIIGVVNPGHILQIMGNTKAKSFDMSSHNGIGPSGSVTNTQQNHCQPSKLLHVLPSFDESMLDDDDNRSRSSMNSNASGGPLMASAADHRGHRICAYFLGGYDAMANLRSKIPGESESISFHRERGLYDPNNVIGMTLASMRPYAVPFHSVQVYPPSGLLDGSSSSSDLGSLWGVSGDLARDVVLESFNGSIVGLCYCNDPEDSASDSLLNCNNAGTGVPIFNCVGLGVIRSIDYTNKVFFVLTPVDPGLLRNVTSFVGGNVGLPLDCVYRGVHSDSFPYLSCGVGYGVASTSLGAEVMKSRNHSKKSSKR